MTTEPVTDAARDRVGIGVAAAAADSARHRQAVHRYGHRVVVVGGLRDREGVLLPMRCGSGGVDIVGAVALDGHRVGFDSGCAVGADDMLAGNIFDRVAPSRLLMMSTFSLSQWPKSRSHSRDRR